MEGLTSDELQALAMTGELADLLRRIINQGDSEKEVADGDWNEVAGHIHVLQRLIAAQAGARAYPRFLRLLGRRVKSSCDK